jgi:hypothetical protein
VSYRTAAGGRLRAGWTSASTSAVCRLTGRTRAGSTI